MTVIWTIIIGLVAGIVAKFLVPGDREPSGFILTALLGVAGAFLATWLGQALGETGCALYAYVSNWAIVQNVLYEKHLQLRKILL